MRTRYAGWRSFLDVTARPPRCRRLTPRPFISYGLLDPDSRRFAASAQLVAGRSNQRDGLWVTSVNAVDVRVATLPEPQASPSGELQPAIGFLTRPTMALSAFAVPSLPLSRPIPPAGWTVLGRQQASDPGGCRGVPFHYWVLVRLPLETRGW